jgi:hypothetical protein
MSSRRAPVRAEHPAKPCRIAGRYRPAALAVEYLVYVADAAALGDTVAELSGVAAPPTGSAAAQPLRPSKRVYEMDLEPLLAEGLPAQEAVARMLASPDWPEILSPRKISASQLARLYSGSADRRRQEEPAVAEPSEEKALVPQQDADVPELRRSCEPKFKVGADKRAAAERLARRDTGATSRYCGRYHNLCGSADLDEALRLSRTGNALTKLARMPVSDVDDDFDLLEGLCEENEPLDYAGLM